MTFAFYNDLTKGSEVRFMRKILLVDDNSAIAQELAKLLKRRGYGVQIAATVAGAKEVIEKEPPLFISSDLDLPDGSGLELLDMVRAADADLPFLIASCHASSHYEAEAVRRGVTLCLDNVNANWKMSFFAGMGCHFLAVSMRWVCSLDYPLLVGLKPVKS